MPQNIVLDKGFHCMAVGNFQALYYNSEVWQQLPSLHQYLQQKLLAFSAIAIKMALHYPRHLISYNNLHKMAKRATPRNVLQI
jgi:hypothetical protein